MSDHGGHDPTPGRGAAVVKVDRLRAQVKRLTGQVRVLRAQRQQLAVRVSGLTGETWEDVLESVGVEPQTLRDPGPSAVVPAEELEWLPDSEVALLEAERDEARRWARGYEHGLFEGVDTDKPPAWLTAPLEAEE